MFSSWWHLKKVDLYLCEKVIIWGIFLFILNSNCFRKFCRKSCFVWQTGSGIGQSLGFWVWFGFVFVPMLSDQEIAAGRHRNNINPKETERNKTLSDDKKTKFSHSYFEMHLNLNNLSPLISGYDCCVLYIYVCRVCVTESLMICIWGRMGMVFLVGSYDSNCHLFLDESINHNSIHWKCNKSYPCSI